MRKFKFRQAARLALAAAALVLLTVHPARADDAKPFLNPLFTDGMVLQRNVADPVWGWTTPGAAVTVRVAGQNVMKGVKAVAGADGKWMAHLPPLPVGGPYTLTVTGPQTATVQNVLVGDVWLCSGQSNMEFGVGNGLNGPAEIVAANYPRIRLFTTPKTISLEPLSLAKSRWQVCTPQTVASEGTWNGFSAVAYFFGRDLQRDVPVPIGLIQSSWGGTVAEAWTSEQALSTLPDFQPALTQLPELRPEFAQETADPAYYDNALKAWYAKNDVGTAGNWQGAALDDSAWKTIPLPGYFQDAGIPELSAINGVVWFRRTFDLPAGDAGKDAALHFQADDNDTAWVNGTPVGAQAGAGGNRSYPIAASLLKPTGNVVAVRVLDTGGKGGVVGDPAGLNLEVPGGQNLPLAGPWRYHIGVPLAGTDPLPQNVMGNPNIVTALYDGMISPLVPYGLKGAIWYQGEANVGRGRQYQTLLPTMIKDWRTRFGVGDFPFLIVQLANYGQNPAQPSDSAWAELREAQSLTAQRTPKVGLAVTVDIGDPNDIHPKNKQEVGRRLALAAEAVGYGKPVEDAGPTFQSMTAEGGAVRLHFTHAGGGLVAKGGDKLQGFSVAGANGKYAWADARIVGTTVLVSSPDVPAPVAVRYGWADSPVCNLYNAAGLPASPFRTDAPVPVVAMKLPANAGPNLALRQPVVASDANQYGWSNNLTDGSWEPSQSTCWASGMGPTFPKTVTIDLQKVAPVGLVLIGVPPFGSTKTVTASVSTDGAAFTDVGSYVFSLNKEEKHLFTFGPKPARFVRLTYPDHHDEAVTYPNTYVFTTECEVYAPSK